MLEELLHRASDPSARLTVDEGVRLYREAPLHALRTAAHDRRMSMEGEGIVTYLVDRNINYTNACTINCQFCSFYRPPGHEEVYTQSFDQISARVRELEAIGGSRILMQGGVNPDLGLDYYVDLLKHLRTTHPTIDLDCFSPIEIHGIASVTGQDLRSVLTVLKDAGLHGLPGGGAEMLVPEVRRDIAPKKGGPDGWLEVMEMAQSLGLITSATNVIGFGEDLGQRLEHMNRVRTLQDDALNSHGNGFTSFIAWPVQLETNVFGRRNRGRNRIEKGAGPTEYLRHVAVSRIFLDNVPHIQASWPTMGLATAQMALHGGADDIGSTMMEENVVSASGTTKVLTTETELQDSILRSGFRPVKRNSRYEHLPTTPLITTRSWPAQPPLMT